MEELNVEEIVKAKEMLIDMIKKMCDEIADVIKNAIEIISKELKIDEKPKFRFVKSLIKPYKQPFIKIRHRARTNC